MPVAPLTLVSAAFDSDTITVTLAFDRAIDIAGVVVGGDVIVDDGSITGSVYEADGATLASASSVRFTLSLVEDSTSSTTTLTASGATGIVAVDDGGTWGGVTALELPWP